MVRNEVTGMRSCPARIASGVGDSRAAESSHAAQFEVLVPLDMRIAGWREAHFVNADLIASGLSPLRPESAAIAASKLFLVELDRLARSRSSFAFESTLSGLAYASRLEEQSP
jgi:hypothetical protein